MAHEQIIGAVEKSIEELCREFRDRPTLFYTEEDIASFFYALLQHHLSMARAHDRDGSEHFLVHREYPAPFRSDLSGGQFAIKRDDERTADGTPYPRGVYSVVVLNPEFMAQYSYELIKAQDYALFKKLVLPHLDKTKPAVLFGMACILRSDPFPLLIEDEGKEIIDGFVAEVNTKVDHLIAGQSSAGFMGNVRMLTFLKGGADQVRTFLFKKLTERPEVLVCFSY
ncbi:MAG: hypothetical protein A2Z19_07210 [Deltaproteobacteria bacterium RBG_16_54_18]|nr:MAG: hypothetical protein A2Z19_07210 [Deltaproteobacteria bacterium RBG_16_54_18]